MDKNHINFIYIITISTLIHFLIFFMFFLYSTRTQAYNADKLNNASKEIVNVLIMNNSIQNINENDIKDYNKQTLLSEKDSKAKGKLTEKKGRSWISKSMKFLKKGDFEKSSISKKANELKIISSNQNIFKIYSIKIEKQNLDKKTSKKKNIGNSKWNQIPGMSSFTKNNAAFVDNNNNFSYNTKKFKDAKYFRDMFQKIGQNWYPPVNMNGIMPRNYDASTGGYAPGRTKFDLISNQVIKLYFVLNRKGQVKGVYIVDSTGDPNVEASCVNAIKQANYFGPIPEDIPGEEIIIPVVFNYIVK